MSTPRPILDLDRLDRLTVRIGEAVLQLQTREQLPPWKADYIARRGLHLRELMQKLPEPLSETEEAEMRSIPREVCTMVLRGDAEVIKALDDDQAWAVCNFFMNPAEATTPETTPATTTTATTAT